MTRFRRPVLAIGAVLFAISATGCGGSSGTPSPTPQPRLSDPNEIVARSFARLESTTAFHVDGTLGGSINAGSLGQLTGGALAGMSGTIKVDGTLIAGDVDMTNQAFDMSLALPATLFGITAEVILVGGYMYTNVNVLGSKYTKVKVPASVLMTSAAPSATLNFADVVRQLKSRLDSGGVTYVLAGLDTVGGRDAYHVVVNVPSALVGQEIAAIGGSAASGIALDLAPVDYWVYVNSLQPAKLELKASSSTLGNLDLALTLTKYDQPVQIKAPPDSQVQAG